ncbi:cytochrome P450 [Siminovitchia fortis]|uniref:Cytochrome P450 n=1 Tax=Siminovitchia fortis TaxID=254758 RepID=A0A443IJ43_9BACI|nr:cytochrome P450 [Siminovitchia fortis]RWR04400.1 cytochrome P450 [Siminovitchia fortis]WHY82456.1 cytochrome P450 [Siminovitchia fortis]
MSDVNQMPREEGLDHSVSLMREGYLYIPNRRRSFQSDVFETHLLGQKAICMGGKEAAELFYDNSKFKRSGAAPKRVRQTLFGEKGVQTLDGKAHFHRKAMFMSLMSEEGIQRFVEINRNEWEKAVESWAARGEIVLYEEAKKILCKTACRWAGVPLSDKELDKRTDELSSLFESPASIGPEHWKGRNSRNQAEKWIGGLVEQVREGKFLPESQTALQVISGHKDLEGKLLDPETAAVEIINILRPIVAIAIYINFTALALHQFPEQKEKLSSEDGYMQLFVQEVRRYYPFFPFAAARVKKDFTWRNYTFEKNTLTLLDLYGTNHDSKLWDNPDVFNPDRFKEKSDTLKYSLIPQGGGGYYEGHRCPGEWITMEAMKVCADFLIHRIAYEVPEQDLSYSLVSMPSIPKSEIKIERITRK